MRVFFLDRMNDRSRARERTRRALRARVRVESLAEAGAMATLAESACIVDVVDTVRRTRTSDDRYPLSLTLPASASSPGARLDVGNR